MTPKVITVGHTATFKEIVTALDRWKVSALPVLDSAGQVVGVVSQADLLAKEEFRDHDPSRMEQLRRLDDLLKAGAVTAEELMTAPAITIGPDATLAQAARVMTGSRIKRLPVVDAGGTVVGIVSRSDLLKVFMRPDEDIAEDVRREVTSRLFLADLGTVRVAVSGGIVTLIGQISDTSLIPVAARAVRAVEGVVDVECKLTASTRRAAEPPVVGSQD